MIKSIIFISLIILGWDKFGFTILGISYAISNLIGVVAIYLSTNYLSGFNYSSINIKYSLIFAITIFASLTNMIILKGLLQNILSLFILFTVTIFCYLRLSKLIKLNEIFYAKYFSFRKKYKF